MTSIEGRVRGFTDVWQKRRLGELPVPDLIVTCSKCSVHVMEDQKVEFINGGIVCIPCFDRSKTHSDSL